MPKRNVHVEINGSKSAHPVRRRNTPTEPKSKLDVFKREFYTLSVDRQRILNDNIQTIISEKEEWLIHRALEIINPIVTYSVDIPLAMIESEDLEAVLKKYHELLQ